MKMRRSSSSNIIDFPDIDYGNAEIDEHIRKISDGMSPDLLPDWTLIIRFVFGHGDWVGVVKRGIPYPATKEKDISIVIPVPTLDQAPYGLSKTRFLRRPTLNSNDFFLLPVDWKRFANMRDYLCNCAIRGIDEAFLKGITVGGMRVTIPEK
jgi:hypothetical protein